MDSADSNRAADPPDIRIRMLGPLTITRQGKTLALPPSRKVRAMLAYLALAPRAPSRTHLTELLWDAPNDPRGELRWSLSKIRGLLDQPDRKRVVTPGAQIALDLGDCDVDAIEIGAAAQAGIEKLDIDTLRSLAARFAGEFLEGLELEMSPHFNGWLVAQRRRFHGCHVAILEQLARSLPPDSDEVLVCLEQWLAHAPLDARAHEMMLERLALRARVEQGEKHLAAAVRLFESEGLDVRRLRDAWREARLRSTGVSSVTPSAREAPRGDAGQMSPRRASIAVMPLVDQSGNVNGGVADGLAHDVITRLAKLRSFAVIAQGTVFALSERNIGPAQAGRALNVDYLASGSIRRHGERLRIAMELVETRLARIIWAEDFDYRAGDALVALDEIGNRIVAAIASEIETAERNRALLKPPSSLDAWEAYHRGLWHMYRFNDSDNQQAHRFLQTAVRLDPTFSRAHAALSFTHFQNAFLHKPAEREQEIDRALATAGQSLIVDDRDPSAHWAMGRALWLRGNLDQSLVELERAVDLSPNFALGHYTLAFVHCQSGDPRAAVEASDHSRHLSPFDPLLFAMLATRALALARLGQVDEAASWALSAAGRPNAHVHIRAIAAHCLAAANRLDEARALMALVRKSQPGYGFDEFLSSFRFAPDAEALVRKSAQAIGIR
jgi:DNA-binding SARP family transcriptional activator/TolB-like protein